MFLSVGVVYKLRREELLYLLSSSSQMSKDASSIRLDKYCVNFLSVFILIRITFRIHVQALHFPDREAVSFLTSFSISGYPLLYRNGFLFLFLKPHTQSNCLVSCVLLRVFALCVLRVYLYYRGYLQTSSKSSLRSLVTEINF